MLIMFCSGIVVVKEFKAETRELEMGITNNYKFLTKKCLILKS